MLVLGIAAFAVAVLCLVAFIHGISRRNEKRTALGIGTEPVDHPQHKDAA